MSGYGKAPTFRLLDARVGWEATTATATGPAGAENEPGATLKALLPGTATGLAGLEDETGVTLAELDPGAPGAEALSPLLPPPWLAPGCGPCDWFMATPARDGLASRLLRLGECGCGWDEVWPPLCTPLLGADLVAIAVAGQRVALADRAQRRIVLAEMAGPLVIADIQADAIALGFDCCGALLAAVQGEVHLRRFDPSGGHLTPFSADLPGPILRLAATPDETVWVVTPGTSPAAFHLWRARPGDTHFVRAALSELAAIQPPSSLVTATPTLVCLPRTGAEGETLTCCWSRFGSPVPPPPPSKPAARYQREGELLTLPIDSGIPRCSWHRVRLDADLPTGTEIAVAVAALERQYGTPHELDWQEVTSAQDWLIQQPPGRYLHLHLRLRSTDGVATPRLRRIRLDFPRATSLDLLPAIYRADPDAENFTARLLALFDASLADLDSAIERAPALLDADGVPDELLPWLGSFLGLVFDPAWDAARRRTILRALPELYRQRGTLAGLKLAFKLVFDLDPVIDERGPARPWGALGRRAQLGSLRLFGRNRSRARIGRSVLGQTVLKSWGDPARDPLDALAWRVQVLLPPSSASPKPARLLALLDSQKPAHVLASLRVGGDFFLVGARSAVGIDTAFLPPPAPVLGRNGSVRLGRGSVLRRGRRAGAGLSAAFVVGQAITE
jgi:phage tail-like protein